ncbi:hypothetical protein [Kushneria aurantia]|uniref:Uncharacterized protein n=1 Tax=Kushneria aurantia TaxID=504092 RepID=A0ABV6G015_9GAMM|nr:hypothetical protein [Kushneria aurantia]
MCGNAYDPSVYAYWEGPRAAGFINMVTGVELVGDKAIAAAGEWQQVMESQRGSDYVIDLGFACEYTFDEAAARLFRDVRISRVIIGGGVEGPQCG